MRFARWGMSSEQWREVRLGDLVQVAHGCAFKTKFATDEPGPYALFTRKNVALGGGFREDVPRYYHGDFEERFVLSPGDVLIVLTDLSKNGDLLGLPAIVPADAGVTYLHNQRMGKVLVQDEEIDKRYLYALLRSPEYRRHVLATATQTTVRDTAPSRVHDFKFLLPSLPEQRRIGAVVAAFDQKIGIQERIARTLDELGEAIFAEWFAVHRDRPSEPLAVRVQLLLGGTPARKEPAYWSDGTVAWVASGKANEFRILAPSEWITERAVAESATKLLPSGTTVLAITGATMGQVSRLEIDACANQSVIGLLGNETFPDSFLFYWLRRSIPELLRRQTGAAQQHVNKTDVGELRVPSVPVDESRALSQRLDPLLTSVAARLREAETLAAVRDELLPHLIRGSVQAADLSDDAAVLVA